MAIFRKGQAFERALEREYKYCKVFVNLGEAITCAGGEKSKVSLLWNNDSKSITCEIIGIETKVIRVFQNVDYIIYLRLTRELEKFKKCRVEKRFYL